MPASALREEPVGGRERWVSEPSGITWIQTAGLFLIFFFLLIGGHLSLISLPYFWDEAGYYIPAARDLIGGSLIPHSTPSNAHPPLVMAWLALMWKVFGQSIPVTRCSMLALAALSLTGFFRLAKTASNSTVAILATVLLSIYPVFFAQSSLAQVDLPAAGLTFWGLEAYFRKRRMGTMVWFSLAALAKETAVLVPLALCAWELLKTISRSSAKNSGAPDPRQQNPKMLVALLSSGIPLALWFAYHYFRTGFVFGNPEFLRYNLQSNLSPLRIVLAWLLRVWQCFGYLNLYVLTLACVLAMRYSPQPLGGAKDEGAGKLRPRISPSLQSAILAIALVYLAAMSVLGGAVLARYMLPVVPLVILVCVSTIWRRLRFWKFVLATVALAFIAGLVVNPPYGFSPEDNHAYADYVRMHQRADAFIQAHYPRARVLTAWPASDELSRPYLGYVESAIQVVRIEDFTEEQLMSAADLRSSFDIALVFSTKYQPPSSFLDGCALWRQWKTRFFGYHEDMTPSAAASVLGGNLVYSEHRKGQWVGIILVEGIQEARVHSPAD
jgi:4-amino-4-deoxy-L-arabinose transferase-like glycosyltransferase